MIIAFGFYYLSIGKASCSLITGVCTMAIANEGYNSSFDLVLAANQCPMDLVYAKNSTVTTYTSVNGTVGGQITSGLHNTSNVVATCTVPTSLLTYESNGSVASGGLYLKLANNFGPDPAGKTASVPFDGTWTTSPAIISTTTSTVTNTVTATIPGITQSTTAVLYGTAVLIGLGAAFAAMFLARRVSMR
jgi:hypothetical protein